MNKREALQELIDLEITLSKVQEKREQLLRVVLGSPESPPIKRSHHKSRTVKATVVTQAPAKILTANDVLAMMNKNGGKLTFHELMAAGKGISNQSARGLLSSLTRSHRIIKVRNREYAVA